MPVKLYELIEAVIKLRIEDGVKELIRSRVLEGRFSRNAYDIAICLHYFGSSYALTKIEQDLRAYAKAFQDLQFMQVDELRSQHLDYLVRGLSAGIVYLIEGAKEDDKSLEIMQRFMPKLISSIDADLIRYELRNVIYVLSSFQKLHEQSTQLHERQNNGVDFANTPLLFSE